MIAVVLEAYAARAAELRAAVANAPYDCPDCGSPLTITEAITVDTYAPTYHTKGQPLPTRERATIVAACSGCEFIQDLLPEVR